MFRARWRFLFVEVNTVQATLPCPGSGAKKCGGDDGDDIGSSVCVLAGCDDRQIDGASNEVQREGQVLPFVEQDASTLNDPTRAMFLSIFGQSG